MHIDKGFISLWYVYWSYWRRGISFSEHNGHDPVYHQVMTSNAQILMRRGSQCHISGLIAFRQMVIFFRTYPDTSDTNMYITSNDRSFGCQIVYTDSNPQCYLAHRHLNSEWYTQTHSLIGTLCLAMIASNADIWKVIHSRHFLI